MKVLIVAGGNRPSKELLEKYVKKADLIIAADRGVTYLLENNIMPNFAVGDFDSADNGHVEILEKSNCEILKFKPEKDLTDSYIAFNLAVEKEADEIFFLAVTGTRLDHTLANLGLIERALKHNVKAWIIDDNNKIFIINESSIIKKENEYKYITFLPYGGTVKNFNILQAKYELHHYDLNLGDEGRTVSNEFLNDNIELKFNEGKVLVIYSRD